MFVRANIDKREARSVRLHNSTGVVLDGCCMRLCDPLWVVVRVGKVSISAASPAVMPCAHTCAATCGTVPYTEMFHSLVVF